MTSFEPIYILSISANDQDHVSLANVFGQSRWVVVPAASFRGAAAELNRHNFAVIVCDCDSTSEDWTEMLVSIQAMPHPPAVILTSRIADDVLWSQALQSGAWDVLPKPFRTADAIRSVRYGWEHWRHHQRSLPAIRPMSATG